MMEPKGIVGACERARDQWISVAERMPEKGKVVLVFDTEGEIGMDYRENQFAWSCYDENEVTHWMPLPEPPK